MMNPATDNELLRQFARTHAEDAFAELVRRHVHLVYSAALRQASGDTHRAQDVVQTVFADFARKAATLVHRDSLTGWFYTSAHFAAANILRAENRRREREENFMRDPATARETSVPPASAETGDGDADWEAIRPALDAAMHELNAADREAVLLRYFENRPFAEVGARLGLGENAARMRVERALDKLRARFARHGITTSGALAATLSAHAVQTAPAGLAAALPAASLAAAGTGTLTKIMIASKIKLALGALAAAGAATLIVAQHQNQARLRTENAALQQQIAQLQADNASPPNSPATGNVSDAPSNELLALRGEVGVLRQQTNELGKLRGQVQAIAAQMKSGQLVQLTPDDQFSLQGIHRVNDMKHIGLEIRLFAGDNNGTYPTNFLQMANLGGLYDWPDLYEFVNVGVANGQNPTVIAIRERVPRQNPNGTGWERVYGFSDGSVQTAYSRDGNFDQWEKRHSSPPPAQ